jgi:VanZ family protein
VNILQAPLRIRLALLILYFLFITFLFCLPGSALPEAGWLDKIWFDKWVHAGIFGLAGWAGLWNRIPKWQWAGVLAVYGAVIELIQDAWVPNRAMDLGDWIADMVGLMLSIWLWDRYIKK